MKGTLPVGRTFGGARPSTVRHRCISCDSRLVYGTPQPSASWVGIGLSDRQVAKLTTAAAEFDDLYAELIEEAEAVNRLAEAAPYCDELAELLAEYGLEDGLVVPTQRPTAVEFMDWARPDIIKGASSSIPPPYDGRGEEERLPIIELPRTVRPARSYG